ncbi:hypothetical protein [Ancrocorticia populi]|uniref:Uncharacterized protein n=1 Tax=Ancrocorticia populi TaxID=2175228 RepID=A0A2V1KBM6_9ACTO|nr:hypothetical protein [Ancrocorticia populi]PWF27690.1 hypothetical protein DD236_04785 [Ancrocorticia populi]
MAHIITLVLTFGITVFVLLRSRRVYAKPAPLRQRVSKIMLFAGILLLVVGLLMAIVMLGTPDEGWTVGPIVSALGMVAGGLFFVYYYSNSFVDVFPDRVVYRGMGRKAKTFEYKDIWKYDVYQYQSQKTLRVWDPSGRKYRLNITNFNGGALLNYIQWLQDLNAYARSNYPEASQDQIQQWVWDNQQARASEELKQARAAAASIASESLSPSGQQQNNPQQPSNSTTADPRATFGGADALGSGKGRKAPGNWNPLGEGSAGNRGAAPHSPFYDK